MGSANAAKNSASGWNKATSDSESQGGNQATNYGSSYGNTGSTSTQGVWGAQDPALQSLYAGAQGLLGGNAQAQQADSVSQQARSAWAQSLQPGQNPYFQNNVQGAIDQASDSWKRSILPELDARGTAAGQYGGARDNLARGEAAGQFGQSLTKMTGDLYGQQYGIDAASRAQALGQTGAMQGSIFAPQQQAQSMIGGPTVLGNGSSFGTSGSSQAGQSSGWNSALSSSLVQGANNAKGMSGGMSIGGK